MYFKFRKKIICTEGKAGIKGFDFMLRSAIYSSQFIRGAFIFIKIPSAKLPETLDLLCFNKLSKLRVQLTFYLKQQFN